MLSFDEIKLQTAKIILKAVNGILFFHRRQDNYQLKILFKYTFSCFEHRTIYANCKYLGMDIK
jgi:hypothetical protein